MTTTRKRGGGDVVAGGVILALALAAFFPVFSADFVAFDDPAYVLYPARDGLFAWEWGNVVHWFRTPVVGHYLPLTMLSYMLDCGLWGLSASGFHTTSLLLHAGSGWLFYCILRQLRFDWLLAVFLAAVFVVHPMRVESVAWVSERKDVLCLFLALAATLRFLAGLRRAFGRPDVWATVLYALALLAKPMVVTLPFVWAILAWREDVARREPRPAEEGTCGDGAARREPRPPEEGRRPLGRLCVWPVVPAMALGLAAVPLTIWTQRQFGALSSEGALGPGLLVAAGNLARYAAKLVAPVGFCPLYPRQRDWRVSVVWAVAGVAVVVLAGCWTRRRDRRLFRDGACCLVAYGLVLAPVSGIVPMGMVDFADRYSTFCHIPLLVLAGLFLRRAPWRVWWPAAAASVVVLVSMTVREAQRWYDTDELWGSVLARAAPTGSVNPFVYVHYSRYLLGVKGDAVAAARVSEQGFRSGVDLVPLMFVHARSLHRLGHSSEAAQFYLSVAPEAIGVRDRLLFLHEAAETLLSGGYPAGAERFARLRWEAKPDAAAALLRGAAAKRRGHDAAAARWFERAARLDPSADMRARIEEWL